MKKTIQRKRFARILPYSLIELLSAMTVFSLLMMALMQFLVSAQKIWTGSNAKTVMFEDARVAMNLLSRDINEIFYTQETGGFGIDAITDGTKMAFTTRVDGKPNSLCNSNIAIVTWEYDSVNNLLKRQVLGDVVGPDGATKQPKYDATNYSKVNDALTTTVSNEVIERVVGFKLNVYKKDMGSTSFTIGEGYIPYLVTITISLLDQSSYDRWRSIDTSTDPSENHIIVKNNMRTFTKYIFIGDRGQR